MSTTTSRHAHDEIHVWVRPAAPSLEEYEALPASERERADGIVPPGKRNQFVAGRALVRRVLAARLCVEPHEVPIVTSDTGRPRLAEGTSFDFSTSHAGGLVIVAVARNTRVGVDIEVLKTRRAHHAHVSPVFQPILV